MDKSPYYLWQLSLGSNKKNMLLHMSFMEVAIFNVSAVYLQVWVLMLLAFMNMHELACT